MKLAEALAERADAQKRLEQLGLADAAGQHGRGEWQAFSPHSSDAI